MSNFKMVEKYINESLSFLDNEYIATTIKIFLTVYAAVWAPKLPAQAYNIFKNDIFKLFVFILVIWVGTKDISLALLISLAFLISMNSLRNLNIGETVNQLLKDSPIPYLNDEPVEEEPENVEPSKIVAPEKITSVLKNQLAEQDLDSAEELLEDVRNDIQQLLNQESSSSSDEPDLNLPGFNDELNQGRNGSQTNEVLENHLGHNDEEILEDENYSSDMNEVESFNNLGGESAVYAPLHPDLKHQGPQGLQGIRGIEGNSVGSWFQY